MAPPDLPTPSFFSHGKVPETHGHRGAGFQTFRTRPFWMVWGTVVDIMDQLE